jgi:drug/metabolite transporter (DMT)-like permease
MQKQQLVSYLELHFIVILIGFTAILGKLISISATELVFLRTILASFGLFCLLFLLKKPIKIPKNDAIKLIGVGFFVGLHWFLFFYSARIANVSVSLVGLATSTLWVALLQPFFGKSKIKKLEIALGFCMIFGLYLIFNADLRFWLGLVLSIGSAFTQAMFSLFNAKFTQKFYSLNITFYEMLGAAIITGLVLIFLGDELIFTGHYPLPIDWLWLAILAGACTVYAYTAIVRLLKNISPFSVNLAFNLEPVYGIILAYFIFGESEKMTSGFYAGTFIIFIAVFGYQIFGHEKSSSKN